MNEIHAYRNDDGTYKVEILGVSVATKQIGYQQNRIETKSKIEIPKANITIDPIVLDLSKDEIFRIRLGNSDRIYDEFDIVEVGEHQLKIPVRRTERMYHYTVNTFDSLGREPVQLDGEIMAFSETDAINRLIINGAIYEKGYEFLELSVKD